MRLSLVNLARRIRPAYDPNDLQLGLGKYTTDYSNLPERYIKRKITKVKYKAPEYKGYAPKLETWRIRTHTLERPWTERYWQEHLPFDKSTVPPIVEPILEANWMWFRGDRVEVLKGPDKGKQGYINMIVQERNWVTVEGLNCRYTTMGETPDFPGMMFKEEMPLLVTKDIRLVDPLDEKPAEVEWRYTEAGERVRVSLRSGTVIPVPSKAAETIDYKTRSKYVASKTKDTEPKVVEDITYEPKLATFEMDIMAAMNIQETRKPRKTYWY